EVVIVITNLLPVLILFGHTSTINGWTQGQMLELLGVFYLVQGAQSVVFETSFERFMDHVRLGTLDFVLIQPVDWRFMVSTGHVQIRQLGQIALGVVILNVGIQQAGSSFGVFVALVFAITLTCGLTLVYCLLLVLSTLAFWFVRVENLLAIFWSFLDAG